jgi:phospholipase C
MTVREGARSRGVHNNWRAGNRGADSFAADPGAMASRPSSSPLQHSLTRRTFVAGGAAALAGGGVAGRAIARGRPWWHSARDLSQPLSSQREALRVLGKARMRLPDSVPNAAVAAGTDTMPQIEHVVVLMMENHSYDNFFGMLGRQPGGRARGDGFRLAQDGLPDATNPYPDGRLQRAFRMPTTCQFSGTPSQEWAASHNAYNDGANDGFVRTTIDPFSSEIVGAVAMGYWTGDDLPFTYDLATRFPIGDRWFCSCLAQTDPNRRYLIAATSSGMTDDIGTGAGSIVPDATLGAPANGTIFDRLTAAGISWADYTTSFPTGSTMELYPSNDAAFSKSNAPPIDQFFTDAKAGTLPAFSLVDPDYDTQSQENPQNIVIGEAFLAKVVNALGASPLWTKTLLIITYDEHGGYYDHVPPPAALAPDSIPPTVQPTESTYDGFRRYGFRVPSVLVGPYVKPGYVSSVVHDHTSVLAFLERKWNLQAMTYRDANANDLTDFLDLQAIANGQPTFPELPALAAAGDTPGRLACTKTGPGTVPVSLPPQQLTIRSAHVNRRLRRVVVELEVDRGTLRGLDVEVYRGTHRVTHHFVADVGTSQHRVVLRLRGRRPRRGHYTVVVRQAGRKLAQRTVPTR